MYRYCPEIVLYRTALCRGWYYLLGSTHVGKKLSIGNYDEFFTKEVFKTNISTKQSEK